MDALKEAALRREVTELRAENARLRTRLAALEPAPHPPSVASQLLQIQERGHIHTLDEWTATQARLDDLETNLPRLEEAVRELATDLRMPHVLDVLEGRP